MFTETTSQDIFERYLRGELSLADAADAVTALVMERKASGGGLAGLRVDKPEGVELDAGTVARADAFFDEMNRRGRAC